GDTYKLIEADGLKIDAKIRTNLSGKNENSIAKGASITLTKFTEYFSQTRPDAVMILGDRYEILTVAMAAVISNIPVIHIHGGEISEGAKDDLFRHAITKLSSLHFTSCDTHRKRVIQMGEQPARVKVSGAPGIDNVKNLKLKTRQELEKEFDSTFGKTIFLVTFHPATMEKTDPSTQMNELLKSLNQFKDASIFISGSNADEGGDRIQKLIDGFVIQNKRVIYRNSFGQLNYLSLMKIADVVIGNSSSGIIEAPSLKTPTVDIGSRQKGRTAAKSVIHCKTNQREITSAITKALKIKKTSLFKNPYDQGNSAEKIVNELRKTDLEKLIPKIFYDLK
ncbi:MAG TPA: UDP-N-acetylglucosamine 2-epimerase, partial [Bacteroidia bacterium]|nr:UDP-N-acetylglucosamine 2-epimerase [Bacteroidia bacterium]